MKAIRGTPCDLCGNTEFDLVFYHNLLDGPLVKCKNCGLVQVNPREGAYLINFRILQIKSVGKSVSFRFLLNRIERLIGRPTKVLLKTWEILGLEERTIYINPGDIMLVIAKKEAKGL